MTDESNAIKALAPFVGTWNTEGKIEANSGTEEQRLVATDIYEWLPGKGFLLHRVDARLGDHITRSIEMIGWDGDAGEFFSTSYDDKGVTSHFRCALEDRDWKINGKGIRFRGAFEKDWNELSGTWEMGSNGSWSPWMDIRLARAD